MSGFAFSPDGSKFATGLDKCAFVYDVASLARLGTYTTPSPWADTTWAPDGRRVLVSWPFSAFVWDFSRPEEAPSVVTADVGPDARFHSWSPGGASYFAFRKSGELGQKTYALEERRSADGSLVRAVSLGPRQRWPCMHISPDAHALLLSPSEDDPARIAVFD